MALEPVDEAHALQIQAGVLGRHSGHRFEDAITATINALPFPIVVPVRAPGHVGKGDPALILLARIGEHLGLTKIEAAHALSTGALATSEEGKRWLSINGISLSRCKSDIVVTVISSVVIVPRTIVRCLRQRKRWPWSGHSAHLHVALADLRSEYGIRVAGFHRERAGEAER